MYNKITFLLAAAFLFGCLQKKNSTVGVAASVNDVFLTETVLRGALAANPDIRANEHINAWINNELLYQAALGMGVPLDIKLKSTINKISRHLTIKTYIDLVCSGSLKITNQEIKEYYNKIKNNFFGIGWLQELTILSLATKKKQLK
jgi:hypothetical protein